MDFDHNRTVCIGAVKVVCSIVVTISGTGDRIAPFLCLALDNEVIMVFVKQYLWNCVNSRTSTSWTEK